MTILRHFEMGMLITDRNGELIVSCGKNYRPFRSGWIADLVHDCRKEPTGPVRELFFLTWVMGSLSICIVGVDCQVVPRHAGEGYRDLIEMK
jgi:hypothetical protein